nr:MAG TPA: hypothetical protein [Caudoviricetes sp.]
MPHSRIKTLSDSLSILLIKSVLNNLTKINSKPNKFILSKFPILNH